MASGRSRRTYLRDYFGRDNKVGMKQKVVIRALVRRGSRVLLLRRSGGRQTIDGLYELPGGSLQNSRLTL